MHQTVLPQRAISVGEVLLEGNLPEPLNSACRFHEIGSKLNSQTKLGYFFLNFSPEYSTAGDLSGDGY